MEHPAECTSPGNVTGFRFNKVDAGPTTVTSEVNTSASEQTSSCVQEQQQKQNQQPATSTKGSTGTEGNSGRYGTYVAQGNKKQNAKDCTSATLKPPKEEKIIEWNGYNAELRYVGDGTKNQGAVYTYMLEQASFGGQMSRKGIAGKKWFENSNYVPRLLHKNLRFDGSIGSGYFSQVWKASLLNDQNVAVKQFRESPRDLDESFQMIMKERDILIFLKETAKKRVVNIIGAFFQIDPFIVMEHCYCDLKNIMGKSTGKHMLRYFVHILEGLRYIHSKGIWHLDMRLDNVLVTTANNAVLADFGCAMVVQDSTIAGMKTQGIVGYYWNNDYEGNQNFLYGAKSDIWGAACTIFEMENSRPLMRRDNYPRDRYFYAKIAKYGHPLQRQRSQPLQTVCLESRYGPLLRLMLTPTWNGRLDADSLLKCPEMQILCKKFLVNQDNCDNELSVLMAPPPPVRALNFRFFADENTPRSYGSEMATIYYDELEHFGYEKNPPYPMYRPLASFTSSQMVDKMIKDGTLQQFITGIGKQDPLAVGLINYVIDDAIGDVKGRKTNAATQTARERKSVESRTVGVGIGVDRELCNAGDEFTRATTTPLIHYTPETATVTVPEASQSSSLAVQPINQLSSNHEYRAMNIFPTKPLLAIEWKPSESLNVTRNPATDTTKETQMTQSPPTYSKTSTDNTTAACDVNFRTEEDNGTSTVLNSGNFNVVTSALSRFAHHKPQEVRADTFANLSTELNFNLADLVRYAGDHDDNIIENAETEFNDKTPDSNVGNIISNTSEPNLVTAASRPGNKRDQNVAISDPTDAENATTNNSDKNFFPDEITKDSSNEQIEVFVEEISTSGDKPEESFKKLKCNKSDSQARKKKSTLSATLNNKNAPSSKVGDHVFPSVQKPSNANATGANKMIEKIEDKPRRTKKVKTVASSLKANSTKSKDTIINANTVTDNDNINEQEVMENAKTISALAPSASKPTNSSMGKKRGKYKTAKSTEAASSAKLSKKNPSNPSKEKGKRNKTDEISSKSSQSKEVQRKRSTRLGGTNITAASAASAAIITSQMEAKELEDNDDAISSARTKNKRGRKRTRDNLKEEDITTEQKNYHKRKGKVEKLKLSNMKEQNSQATVANEVVKQRQVKKGKKKSKTEDFYCPAEKCFFHSSFEAVKVHIEACEFAIEEKRAYYSDDYSENESEEDGVE